MSKSYTAYAAFGFSALVLSGCTPSDDCRIETFEKQRFTVCAYDVTSNDIRIFLNDPDGKPYGSIPRFRSEQTQQNRSVIFAMNGGMYHSDLSPVGLLKIDGKKLGDAALGDGFGNFFLKPNGYLQIEKNFAAIHTMDTYAISKQDGRYATQSGPMLVINGKLHPKFIRGSTSLKLRNGVGVSADGKRIFFAISHRPVNFYDFGSLFKDRLQTPNALFLDGTISTLYHPTYARPNRYPVGPIIAILAQPKPSLTERAKSWFGRQKIKSASASND